MGTAFNTLIVTLMAYFVLMSLTVERAYCSAPLEPSSTVPFVPEAVAFCAKANPLFLQRPEWLRLATCFSAYCLCPFYLLIGEGLGHGLGLGWRGAAVRVTAERPQPQPQPQP